MQKATGPAAANVSQMCTVECSGWYADHRGSVGTSAVKFFMGWISKMYSQTRAALSKDMLTKCEAFIFDSVKTHSDIFLPLLDVSSFIKICIL